MIRDVFGSLNDPWTGIAFLVAALVAFIALLWTSLGKQSDHFTEQARLPLEETSHEP